jgi:hypothetical protein
MKGDLMVMGPVNRVVNGMPAADAHVVATLVGHANQACIYYYLKGQTMLNGTMAPAKRIGFFWHRPIEGTTTPRSCSAPRWTGPASRSRAPSLRTRSGCSGRIHLTLVAAHRQTIVN